MAEAAQQLQLSVSSMQKAVGGTSVRYDLRKEVTSRDAVDLGIIAFIRCI